MRAELRRALTHLVWLAAVVSFALVPTVLGGRDAFNVSWLASTAFCVSLIGYMAWRRGSPHVALWSLVGLLGVAGLLLVGFVLLVSAGVRALHDGASRSQ